MDTKRNMPFSTAVLAALEERGWSLRELSRRTQDEFGWGAVSTLHQIVHGRLEPTLEAMEHIAEALREPPETFADYRLAVLRRNLDPRAVGLEAALGFAEQSFYVEASVA